jgi:hypothetical protein
MPRFANSTPAISVLDTAPRPTVSTPSLPVAGAIFLAVPADDGDIGAPSRIEARPIQPIRRPVIA